MTQSELTYSGPRSRRLGLLIVLTTVVAFYGTIAACIWKYV
jgi:hypothetical protein